MENSDFVIRKVRDDDFDSLVGLYCDVWPEGVNIHRQKANFVLRESTGVSYCAEKEGRIVGSRTSFCMPMYYGEQKINCVQFADSCIHSSCRRQGLFLKLNQAFLNDFFDGKGGELVYNISVDNSRKAYEKLGWVYIQSLSQFRKYIRPIHMLWKVRFNLKKLYGVVDYDLETHFEKIDLKLFEAREAYMVKNKLLHVRYTQETFEWRLKSKNGIKMLNIPDVGCAIYKVGQKASGIRALMMGDFFLYDYKQENLRAMMKAVCKKECPDMILGSYSLSHPLYQLFIKENFKGNKFVNHGVKVVTDKMRDICLNPKNWAISFLDIDTF